MADLLLSALLPTLSVTKPNYPFLSFSNRTHCQSLLSFKSTPPIFIALVSQTTGWSALEHDKDVEGTEPGLSEWEDEESESHVISGHQEQEQEPSEDVKLFVGNMTFDVDSDGLAKLFNQAGIVETAEVIFNRNTNQSRGFGFVTMSTVEEAEKAVKMFNGHDLNGRLLTVNKAARRGSPPERIPGEVASSFKLYAGNLPWQVDDERLEQVFSKYGQVVDARVVYDRESGRSRGFGFVNMASRADQDAAISALDGESLEGRSIRVNVAEEKPRRGMF